jgi:vacuolar-type H+-ATPase subunit H
LGPDWEQTGDVDLDDQLEAARASRSQAEAVRQSTANEILTTTKEMCQQLMADAERAVERARFLESETEKKANAAEKEHTHAQSARAEADGYRDKVVSEANADRERMIEEAGQQSAATRSEADAYRSMAVAEGEKQAQALLDAARSRAEAECDDIKLVASQEVQRMVAQADMMRAAAREELEAQRLYSETARLKAESQGVLSDVRTRLSAPALPNGNGASNGHVPAPNGKHRDSAMAVVDGAHSEKPRAPRNTKASSKSTGARNKNSRSRGAK